MPSQLSGDRQQQACRPSVVRGPRDPPALCTQEPVRLRRFGKASFLQGNRQIRISRGIGDGCGGGAVGIKDIFCIASPWQQTAAQFRSFTLAPVATPSIAHQAVESLRSHFIRRKDCEGTTPFRLILEEEA